MKIAICISGQPRFVEEMFPNFKKNILDSNPNHEIDVFVHTWYSEDIIEKPLYDNVYSSFSGGAKIPKNVIDTITKLYNPVRFEYNANMEMYKNINWGGSDERKWKSHVESSLSKEDWIKKKTIDTYSYWYSNLKVNLLKKEFELLNNFTYDLVVRTRFDNIYNSPILFDRLSPDNLHYQELNQPPGCVSDWINISSSKNMDIISSIFTTLETISEYSLRDYNTFTNEYLIHSISEKFNIKKQSGYFGITLPSWGKF
jgi:hypothetical protein